MSYKEKLLVSFSGGESSAFMCNWLLLNKSDEYEMKFVFANTGEENEETLKFVDQCDKYFGLNLTWVEFDVKRGKDRGKPSFKIVNFDTAYRSHDNPEEEAKHYLNHPFRKAISRHMIPNRVNKICTRELKERPINRYLSSIGWKPRFYDKAIGIRADELDRLNNRHYFPLAENNITKPMINKFWSLMPFRLQLKGYEGNCKVCWKKAFRKLGTLVLESPEKFDFFRMMEHDFEFFTQESKKHNIKIKPPHRFFRENKSVDDIFKIPEEEGFEVAVDDSVNITYQVSILHDGTELDAVNGCVESCEVYVE